MRRSGGRIGGLPAMALGAGLAALVGGETPPPPAVEPAPLPALPAPADAAAEEPAAPPAAEAPAPTAEDLAALAKTVRFLDAFPGSPADREQLLKQFWTVQHGGADTGFGVDIWAADPVGAWMHGPVPTRVTPTMMLLAWRKVISEHYPDSTLAFAPRLRAWCLRVLERIAARRAALAAAVAAGDADKKLEDAHLIDMAVAFRQAVLTLPGPSDRAAGLPTWTKALPAPPEESKRIATLDLDYGITPVCSNNLAAKQCADAVMNLQWALALRGNQRMTWGPLVTSMILSDREDVRLWGDLNRWIDEYSASAALNNDFLSLASLTQAPRDPEAAKIWKADLDKRLGKRSAALQAAGCIACDAPHDGSEWTLLPVRFGPADALTALGADDLQKDIVPRCRERLAKWTTPRWEALFAGDAELEIGRSRGRSAMQRAFRAVQAMAGETELDRLLALGLLEPEDYRRGPANPAPLRDDEALGPVWVDGGRDFFTALSQAAAAHAEYLQSLGIEHSNADQFGEICLHFADWADRAAPKLDGAAVGGEATFSDLEMRQLLHARQWLAGWLQVDLQAQAQPRNAVVQQRHRAWVMNGVAAPAHPFVRYWTVRYRICPRSQSGLETPDPASGPVLTMSIELAQNSLTDRVIAHSWTTETLATAVLGPTGKGPIRYLDFLTPNLNPGGWSSLLFRFYGGEKGQDLRAITRPVRRQLLDWVVRDPVGFVAAEEQCPTRRDGDLDRLLAAALTVATPEDAEAVTGLVKALPEHIEAICTGLSLSDYNAPELLTALAKQPVTAAMASVYRFADRGPAGAPDANAAFFEWLQQQPDPVVGLDAALQVLPRSVALPWLTWNPEQASAQTRAQHLAGLGAFVQFAPRSYTDRVNEALQLSDRRKVFWWWRPGRETLEPAIVDQTIARLKQAAQDPATRAVALAALAVTDRAAAYPVLEAALTGADAAPMLPPYVFLLGTAVVDGPRPERGRDLLRAWVRLPAVENAGKPRVPTHDENQTWALAVDLLSRQYILTDEDLPALVDRYIQEVGADVIAPRLRLPTHGAFGTAFFINPEMTLDRVAAALGSADRFQRDAALAILTTQVRVDALMGAQPVDLPALENLPLRLEDTPEAARQAQATAWQAWLGRRRGAILQLIREHLE